MKRALLLVNFGGPRNSGEMGSFLKSLLTDPDVIRPKLPRIVHHWLFSRVAKKRVPKALSEYNLIGGRSPIFEDTEYLAEKLEERLALPVITFHRYLLETHAAFFEKVRDYDAFTVFPLFPQFSYATTGSIARFFSKKIQKPLQWIRSYPAHPAYVSCIVALVKEALARQSVKEEEVILLFSAHGIPEEFVATGDSYEQECKLSFQAVSRAFPGALARLAYQSKFGPEEWIKPYTDEVCQQILAWSEGRKHVLVIPISFTSDHIETLYEIDHLYLPVIRAQGLEAYRIAPLIRRPDWLLAVEQILEDSHFLAVNNSLIFKKKK